MLIRILFASASLVCVVSAGFAETDVRAVKAPRPTPLGAVTFSELPTVEDGERAGQAPVTIPNVFPSAGEIPPGTIDGEEPRTGANLVVSTVPGEGEVPQTSSGTDAVYPDIDIRFDGPYQGWVTPPDPVMAAGTDHVVSLINTRIAVYDKSGTLLDGPTSLEDFFGIPSGFNSFDPLAIHDPFSNRFIVVCASRNNSIQDSRLYIAFTQSGDATGTWNRYYIDADSGQAGNWADYPSIGIDRKAVYLTANMFSYSNAYRNVTLYIYDKEDGYAGRSLDNTHLIDVRSQGGGSPYRLRPAFVDEVVPGDVFYLMQSSESFASSVNLFRLTGDRFSSPTISATRVSLPGTYWGPGGARQPGGSPDVSTLGGSLWNVVYRNGDLWTAHALSGSSSIAVWVHRIRVDDSSDARERTYELEDPQSDSYFPHVLPDSEDDDFALLTAFSGPSRYVTGRYWNVGADGTVRKTELLVDSTVRNTSDRHGDYFAAAYDPTDGNRLWMIAQYMQNSSFSGNQKIASVRFEDEGAPGPQPPPLPDGKTISGEPVRVTKAAGGAVTVTWDAATCPASGNHLVWYDLGTLSAYAVAEETCAIGTSGSWTGLPPGGSVAVIVVGNDAGDTEGSHGVDSAGTERPSQSAVCTLDKVTTGTCLP